MFAVKFLILESAVRAIINEAKTRKIKAKFGSNLTLECKTSGIPQPYVYWIDKNGEEVEKHNGVTRLPSGKLLITNVNAKHSGKYVCRSENQFGIAKAEISVVTVGLGKEKKPLRLMI